MKPIFVSQYQAALNMLESVILKCPEDQWDDGNDQAPVWRVAYHTLFYTDLYLSKSEHAFQTDAMHHPGYQYLGKTSFDGKEVNILHRYTSAEVLHYLTSIRDRLTQAVREKDLESPSGIGWLPMTTAELHLYNIRHVQHHTAQLMERLHHAGIHGFPWIGTGE
ncbi:MAG: DinB family protein [Saprospiraceae bacterium]